MRRPRVRLTLRGSMIVVALLAALLAFVVVPISREIERRKRREEYNQVADGMTAALFALKNRVPQGVDPYRWQAAVEWTAVAHFNAFHLRHPPPIEEVYRLRAELMPKLSGPVDMQTLAWAWDRIGRTGVDGKDLTDRLWPTFWRCFTPGTFARPGVSASGEP
jgi:type II secretory pathway pseudopilin PulG